MAPGKLAHTAAKSFHKQAAKLLGYTEGQYGVQAAICKMLKVPPNVYSTALKGRDVSLERVFHWVQLWNLVPDSKKLALSWDGKNVNVVRELEVTGE